LRQFLPDHEIVVLRNSKAHRQRDIGYCKTLDKFVLVVHYESLAIELAEYNKLGPFDIVICDEVHRIRNAGTKQTRAIKKIKAKYRLGLSGSIISNHAEELFSQLQWLFPKTYRSKWRDWNDRYLDFVDGGWGK